MWNSLLFFCKSCSDSKAASGVIPGTMMENVSGLLGVFGLKEVIVRVYNEKDKILHNFLLFILIQTIMPSYGFQCIVISLSCEGSIGCCG